MTDIFKFDWFDSQEERNVEASREGQDAANRESASDGIIHDLVDIVSTAVPIPKTEEEGVRERSYHHQRDKNFYESVLPRFSVNDTSGNWGQSEPGSRQESQYTSATSDNATRPDYGIGRGWAVVLGLVVGFAFLEIAGPGIAQLLVPLLPHMPNWLGVYLFLALWADAILFGVTTTRLLSRQNSALKTFAWGMALGLIGVALVLFATHKSVDTRGSVGLIVGSGHRLTSPIPARDASSEPTATQVPLATRTNFTQAVSTYAPEPSYTDEGRQNKTQGDVVLRILVDANGNVEDVKVSKSLEPSLDESAIQTIRTWKFNPATCDGIPVASALQVKTTFRLF